jgi:hypothetical protein
VPTPLHHIGGLAGAHANLPNSAGSESLMNTQGPQKPGQGQGQGGTTHNGDQVGVQIGTQNFTGNQNADDVNRGIEQHTLSNGGQTFNRSPSVPVISVGQPALSPHYAHLPANRNTRLPSPNGANYLAAQWFNTY